MKTHSSDEPMELQQHLSELRSRLLRCIIYFAVGAVAGWFMYNVTFSLLFGSIEPLLEQSGSKFLLTGIAEGFTFKLQLALFAGAILAMPLATMELWGFISPGLTKAERRGVLLVAPLSVILFAAGVLVSSYAVPIGIKWLIGQNPPQAVFMPSVTTTMLFVVRMVLAFGLVFEMPVILIFLARIGIVKGWMLTRYWRQAVVTIAVAAAVVTPSGDAITMLVMSTPMLLLYLISIGLVRLVQKKDSDEAQLP